VDISQAMKIVGSQVFLPGRSDWELIHRVLKDPEFVAPKKAMSPAAGLQAGITLRPIDALHRLSYATKLRYQDDILDMYMQWGLLRYLGFFELAYDGHPLPGLKLSEAGQRVTGNQRRVTSEEMGIGFGVLLATRWFEQTAAAGIPITAVDIDAALDERFVLAAGTQKAVEQLGARRPDYLVIAHDPGKRSHYRVRVLECKGTSRPSYATRQLASAIGQLSDVTVGGRVPVGLAVSTVTASNGVSFLAIDPDDTDEASYEVNSNTIAQAAGFRLTNEDIADISPTELASASLSASWGMLADFGGNLDALDRWAPTVMRSRLIRRQRERISFDTPFGNARGTSTAFGFDGRQLTVRYAIDETVDQNLTHSPESIIEAQAAFAERLAAPSENRYHDTGYEDLYSATADGSIFALSLK
jgi:hypothetical protein